MVVLLLVLCAAIYTARDLLVLAFGAILIAVLFHAVSDYIEARTPLSHRWSLTLATALVLGAGGVIVWMIGVAFRDQIEALVRALPQAWRTISASLSASPVGAMLVDAITVAAGGSRFAREAMGLSIGLGELLINALIVLVGALFFSANPAIYRHGFLLLLPDRYCGPVGDAIDATGRTLKLWLLTQLVQMTTMGLMVGFGLWFVGIPSAGALGLLAGLSEFIPYVGPTVAMLPALGIAAAIGMDQLGYAFSVYVVVRLIQSNFITPLVQYRVIAIPPALTLFAILGIGVVLGIFGLFFSAALLVVGFTMVQSLYLRDTLGKPIVLPGEHEPPH